MITLETPITVLSRVGLAAAKKLNKLGVETVRDLLFYFPFRYDDFSETVKINNLRAGGKANVVGQILLIQNKRSPRQRLNITEALVADETGELRVVWFNQPFITRVLKEGDKVSLAGKLDEDYGGLVMTSPNYEKAGEMNTNTQGLVPNYHLTENITQKQIRFLVRQAVPAIKQIVEHLPAQTINEAKFRPLSEAISKIHFPKNQSEADEARRRLAFDEIFLVQLRAGLNRRQLQSLSAEPIVFQEEETKRFVASLPFKLTDAQRKTSWAILQDLSANKPMSRLLNGDVGSGKTVVAVIAALNVILNGRQAAIMVPTEILAKQHYNSIGGLLAGLNIKIGLVTNSEKKLNYELKITNYESKDVGKKKDKKIKIDSQFVVDNAQIIIGTHALIQEKIKFNNLALAIIDEQHRFGVAQRMALADASGAPTGSQRFPHMLSMTATPIPRSLALVLFGDLDISLINELPKNRKKIITQIIPEAKRETTYEFIRREINNGRQVFVICPLIDISDKLGVKSVKEEFEKLDKTIFPDLKIGLLHGRMKPAEKDRTMQDFLDNKIKIIVSTSVVEVGVDVPNASIMMIEAAERFGLAQLHQFRGRVGRSDYQSYCFLFSENSSPKTMERLDAMAKYNDGLTLSNIDLKHRGPGEVYGTSQSGFPEFKLATLFDYELMSLAKKCADEVINEDASLTKWPLLRNLLAKEIEKAREA